MRLVGLSCGWEFGGDPCCWHVAFKITWPAGTLWLDVWYSMPRLNASMA